MNILTGRCDEHVLIGQCPFCGGNLTADHDCPMRFNMKVEPEVKAKKFILVPRDAFELLSRRFVTADEATEAASEACAEEGQTMYVVEMKAIAARADRPVKVTKL